MATEKEKIKRHPGEKSLEPFDTAIGKMCRQWAHLETIVTLLFLKVGGWEYTLPMTYPMASFLDFRDKIDATRAGILAWNCRKDIEDLLFGSLDYINNKLRIARNRLVHDIRAPSNDGVSARLFQGAYSISKEPGSGRRVLNSPTFTRITLEEIDEITTDIEEETTFLFKLYEWFRNPHGEPLGPLLAPPPRQYLHRQTEKQSQADKAAQAQKRQQKSS